MQKQKPIERLLRNHQITAQQFLSTPTISSQIRSHLTKFIRYCNRHKVFTLRMIQLAFDVSYEELEDQKIKKASYAANEVFGNEEPEIAQLFFEPSPKEDDDQCQIKEQIMEGIQSQAERLFNFDSDQEQTKAEEQRQVQVSRQELVGLSLQIMRNPDKNETCLGHLQKMYSFFIRHDPIPVLAYFQSHPQTLQLLIKNISYSSSSSLLAQLLTCEDKKKEYKYQPLKKQILQKIIEQIFRNIGNEYYFDGAVIFLDEILNATKQSYFEYFEDFKRISNYLVSGEVLKRCYQQLLKLEQISFCNISRFLQLLCNRINSQNEDNRYYHKEQNEPTMNFEIEIFIENIWGLLQIILKVHNFVIIIIIQKSISKIYYFSFLEALIITNHLKNTKMSILNPSFISVLDAYKLQNTGGICKNKLYHIIKQLFIRASQEEIKQFIQSHVDIYDQYFTTIKLANYSNTRNYNKNQCSGFDVDLIAKMTRKQEIRLIYASKIIGKDLKRICKKYDTKIASYQNSNNFSLEEQFNFCGFDVCIVNIQISKVNGEKQGSGLTVGKNNISIPVLHLPDRYQNVQSSQKEQGERRESGSPDLSPTDVPHSPEAIIQEQEVVVLTNKIRDDKIINLTEVIHSNIEQLDKQRGNGKVPVNSPVKEQQKEEIVNEESNKVVEMQKVKLDQKEVKLDQKEVKLDQKEVRIQSKVKIGDPERTKFYARHLLIFA